MKNKRVKLESYSTLDETINLLLCAKEKGVKAYCDFNGHRLYSDNITVDSAYIEVTGQTKEEYNLFKKECIENLKKEKELAKQSIQNNIPIWIEKGKKLIFEERHEKWEQCVKNASNSIYYGNEFVVSLEIMELLENDNLKEAIQAFNNQNHSGCSEHLVKMIIFEFSSKGPEFYMATTPNKDVLKDILIIELKKQENQKLLKKHSKVLKRKL